MITLAKIFVNDAFKIKNPRTSFMYEGLIFLPEASPAVREQRGQEARDPGV